MQNTVSRRTSAVIVAWCAAFLGCSDDCPKGAMQLGDRCIRTVDSGVEVSMSQPPEAGEGGAAAVGGARSGGRGAGRGGSVAAADGGESGAGGEPAAESGGTQGGRSGNGGEPAEAGSGGEPAEAGSGGTPAADGGSAAVGPCADHASAHVCDRAKLLTCDAAGAKSAEAECGSEMYCELGVSSGRCAVCNPGTFKCEGAALQRCSAEGQYTPGETCASVALCNEAAGACTEMKCTPNAKTCGGDGALQSCNADGSAFDRTSCPNGCDAQQGKCFDCVPGSRTCQMGADSLQVCSAVGTRSTMACSGATPRCLDNKCVACVTNNDCAQDNECIPRICDTMINRCVAGERRAAGTACESNKTCNALGQCTSCGNGAIDSGENCDPQHPAWLRSAVASGERCDPMQCRITERVYTERAPCADQSAMNNACWPDAPWACALGGLQCVTGCQIGNDDPCRTTSGVGRCASVVLNNETLNGCFITCQESINCPRPMVCTQVPGDSQRFCALQTWPMPMMTP